MFAAMKKAAEAMMQQNVTVRKGILWPKRGTDWAIGQLWHATDDFYKVRQKKSLCVKRRTKWKLKEAAGCPTLRQWKKSTVSRTCRSRNGSQRNKLWIKIIPSWQQGVMHWADNCAVQHKVQGVMYDWLKPKKLHSKSMQSGAFVEPYQNTGRRKSPGEEVYHDGAKNVSISRKHDGL